jgi:cytoplasmic iron level regulating protein YaaA (DUF328/UPF0246 family)
MKILLSPAKTLDFERRLPTEQHSIPQFLPESERLNKLIKKKSARTLSRLMGISSQLGELNYERNQEWALPFTAENARPAIYAFGGDVYRGLDIYSLPVEKLDTLKSSLRIISGLYGLLKPLELIQPYRLEMGLKLAIGRNKNLYQFWRKKITGALNAELSEGELCLNLASAEYFKAIDTRTLKVPVLTAEFRDFKNGEYKSIMTYAKLARGYMTRYIADQDVQTLEGLKGFNYEGYGFSEALSQKEKTLVYIR